MSDATPSEADAEPAYRQVFEKRAASWAEGRGLISLLSSLETACPHTFTLATADLVDEAPRPWVPKEATNEHDVKLAYHRASRLLHPDRLTQRDLSVRVEAEEVLKVLTTAFTAKADWCKEAPATSAAHGAKTSKVDASGGNGSSSVSNTDIRNSIFGENKKQTPAQGGWTPSPRQPAAAPTRPVGPGAGGTGLRDNIFAGAFQPKSSPAAAAAVAGDSGGSPFDEAPPPMSRGASYSSPFDDAPPPPPPRAPSQSVPNSSSPFDNPFGAAGGVSDASLSAAAALFSEANERGRSSDSLRSEEGAPSDAPPRARSEPTNPFGAPPEPPSSSPSGNPFG